MIRRTPLPLLTILLALWAAPSAAQFTRVETTGENLVTLATADSLFLNGEFDEAASVLETLAENVDGERAKFLYNRGILEDAISPGGGLPWYKEAYQLDSTNFIIAWSLGDAMTEAGQWGEAEKYLRYAVDQDKGYYESSVSLARNLRKQGRLDEALHAIEKAFGRDRTFVDAYTEYANIYLAKGDFQAALDMLERGYKRFPYEQILIKLVRLNADAGISSEVILYGSDYLYYYPFGPNTAEVLAALRVADTGKKWSPQDGYSFTTSHITKPPEESLALGTNLHYDVKWGLFKVGSLDIDIVDGEYDGEPCWYARYIALSARGLPFISIADTFYAYIDHDLRYTKRLEMYYHEMGYNSVKIYESDYETGNFEARIIKGNGLWELQRHPLPPNVFDASSQLWHAQQLVIAGLGGTCAVELSGGFERTIINNHGIDGEMRVDGRKYDLVMLDGIMRYAGIAGMTGDYQGWYLSREPYWPVIAKFKIFLGWVTIKYNSNNPSTLVSGQR